VLGKPAVCDGGTGRLVTQNQTCFGVETISPGRPVIARGLTILFDRPALQSDIGSSREWQIAFVRQYHQARPELHDFMRCEWRI
jgi:hypothetical protein